MSNEKSYHMTTEEFRQNGRAVIDWIADYYDRIESFPVLSQIPPGEIRASLPQEPPASGESFAALLGDVEKLILPGYNALAVAQFLCLLSLQRFRSRDSR